MKGLRFAYLATVVVLVAIVGIVSSCSSNPSSILVGTWRQDVTYSNVPSTYPSSFRFQFQFNKDNTWEMDAFVLPPGQTTGWVLFEGSKGTYSVSGDIITATTTESYGPLSSLTTPSSWTPVSPAETSTAKYSCSGTTLILTEDINGDGQYDTSHPIQDTYPGGGTGGPTYDITLTLTKI